MNAFGFKTPSVLQQLLEEINFQRKKEMRQSLRDGDGGFVLLQGTTYWTDLFVRHFLFQSEPEHSIDSDDLLFFVRKKHVKGSSRHMPKFETEVDVFRKDSRKLPIGDPDVDWEETVYLNLVIHQFDYKLTLAICTRTSPKELQVLRRHSQKVYASPSRRKMDTKGDSEEITYPHICFMVDNFDEVFGDILVRDGEMVCVELVANDKDGSVQGVIFLGSIRYDALKKVYDSRQSSLSSKVAQRMTFGLFSGGCPQTRCEFVRMKGPQGKGHAEMAVTKPKGSGVETPTSEPGFCATDMWGDQDWEEDAEDFFNYRHQRRLSDPSANLNNFSRHAWRSKPNHDIGAKARSENEGLDSIANELSEIEAGDLRDDRPALPRSVSDPKLHAALDNDPSDSVCCNCFGQIHGLGGLKGSSCTNGSEISQQMSEIYCQANSPACLNTMSGKRALGPQLLMAGDSEIEVTKGGSKGRKKDKGGKKGTPKKEKKEKDKSNSGNNNEPVVIAVKKVDSRMDRSSLDDCEIADDATSLNCEDFSIQIAVLSDSEKESRTRVRGRVELPAEETRHNSNKTITETTTDKQRQAVNEDENGNRKLSDLLNNNFAKPKLTRSLTFPRRKRDSVTWRRWYQRPIIRDLNKNAIPSQLPKKFTPDGTTITYWCDLPKKTRKELDDGAYNPLWATRGFTQTFHFWKENRRQQSTPLNAFLTYLSLPWWSIVKDLLDSRENPILTF